VSISWGRLTSVSAARPELRLRFGGGLGGDADGQSTWLDLRVEGGGLADDVAVELVVVLPVNGDPHPLSRVLVDLVILLGASSEESQSDLDPVPEPAGGGDVEIEEAINGARARYQNDVAPKCADVADHTKHRVTSNGTVAV